MKPFNYAECMSTHDGCAVTKNGHRVRLLCDNYGSLRGQKSVLGIVELDEGTEVAMSWTALGRVIHTVSSKNDIFTPVKITKREAWLNMYPKESETCIHFSRADANADAIDGRIACIKVELEFEVGEGL